MTTVFVRHQVKDFASWKRVFDGNADVRRQGGVMGASVHRDAADPHRVVVALRFADLGTARSFAESPQLQEAMSRSGVVGQPEFWFTEDVEVGGL